MTSSLPQSVIDMATFHPIEDLIFAHLRAGLPAEINVQTLVADDQRWPLVLPRRGTDWGAWGGDSRFIDTGTLYVHTFCEGLNADSDSAYLAEACRVILMGSINKVVPNLGHLTSIEIATSARRVSDWGTAQGPVQYADLPTGVIRYETVYNLSIRAPRK